MNEIVDIHAELDATYGSPRMTTELAAGASASTTSATERLMAGHGIVGVRRDAGGADDHPRRAAPRRCPTSSTGTSVGEPGLRASAATSPTSRPTRAGCTWPPCSISGQPAGRRLGHGRAHAHRARRPGARDRRSTLRGGASRVVFHPTGGLSTCRREYRALCERHGVAQSAGRVGTCFDNSGGRVVLVDPQAGTGPPMPVRHAGRRHGAIIAWIRRYNAVRLHSTLGNVPPIEWELRYRLTELQAA